MAFEENTIFSHKCDLMNAHTVCISDELYL